MTKCTPRILGLVLKENDWLVAQSRALQSFALNTTLKQLNKLKWLVEVDIKVEILLAVMNHCYILYSLTRG